MASPSVTTPISPLAQIAIRTIRAQARGRFPRRQGRDPSMAACQTQALCTDSQTQALCTDSRDSTALWSAHPWACTSSLRSEPAARASERGMILVGVGVQLADFASDTVIALKYIKEHAAAILPGSAWYAQCGAWVRGAPDRGAILLRAVRLLKARNMSRFICCAVTCIRCASLLGSQMRALFWRELGADGDTA